MQNEFPKLQDTFPTATMTVLGDGYGVNIYLKNRVISTYWKKQSIGDSKTGNWGHFDDFNHLIELITEFNSQQEISNAVTTHEFKVDGGVWSCIEHLRKKAELISSKKSADNALCVILKTTADELYQYL